ncbi:hypothetical protein TWF506_002743 [Arthrobotrys conoides]|uniref:Uncharacterized protein n=1 Tax=Arthrobotrys conoides TaxID=74498 RepID=A0AAN8NLY4_9PEZI
MATFKISIVTSRPVLKHPSSPSSRRSLIFFVHRRSGSQQCYIPPSPPNPSQAQPLAQVVNSTRHSNWDYISRSYPWGRGKIDHHQWAPNDTMSMKDGFSINLVKKYKDFSFHKLRHADFDWTYNARGISRKVVSVHKPGLFRALDIMSKPYAYARYIQPALPATVKASARTGVSPSRTRSYAPVDILRGSALRKQQVFEATALSPVPPNRPQEPSSFEVASNTIRTASTPGVIEPGELQQKRVQNAPGVTGVFSLDETASLAARSNIESIDILSQNNNELLDSAPGAIPNKGSDLQTGKKPQPLETTAANVGEASKLSPADLIASLRYYDRERGTLPDEEPLSAEDVAALESSRDKLKKGSRLTSQAEASPDYSTRKTRFKRIGLVISSAVVGVYIFGVGTKLLSVQPESATAAEILSAVQGSKLRKGGSIN